jgi:hypothetical protein
MDRGEFHPARYEDMNATYHALVPQYPLVYEAYKKMHELLTPEEQRRIGLVKPDGQLRPRNYWIFSTSWM